ncbi:hypothetical protein BDW72DRAFT_118505 [Aspergillus terricola var. indicus]
MRLTGTWKRCRSSKKPTCGKRKGEARQVRVRFSIAKLQATTEASRRGAHSPLAKSLWAGWAPGRRLAVTSFLLVAVAVSTMPGFLEADEDAWKATVIRSAHARKRCFRQSHP